MQIASVAVIWRHFAHTFQQVETFNADGSKPNAHTATAAVVFNVPEPEVTEQQRTAIKRALHQHHHTQ